VKSSYSTRFLFILSGLFFLVYGLALTYFTGNVGFEGDDWWIFSWPYWNDFPNSVWLYAKDLLRPIEGVYWITLFELFGFNKTVFHFFSISLLAGASLAMGACLYNLFPNRKVFVAASIFWAFFIPAVSCLTYVVTTDNSRLSLLFFWISVFSFQKWAIRGCSWSGLLLPVSLYLAAFFTYESTSLLILVVPLFVLPLRDKINLATVGKNFVFRIATGIGLAFVIALCARFVFMRGGAVSHSYLVPPFELVWSYIVLFPFYLGGIFDFQAMDVRSIVFGMVAFFFIILFFYYLETKDISKTQETRAYYDNPSYILVLSLVIIIFGMMPYQLAGYGSVIPKISDTVLSKCGFIEGGYTPWHNYNWSSRIYSSASFGFAILLALLMTFWNDLWTRYIAYALGSILIGLAVAFHSSLIVDWTEASKIRNSICRGFVSQVPDIQPNTNFLFVDLESYHKRAAVFRGWNGLRELVQMLYGDPTLGAYYVYRRSSCPPNEFHHQAVFTPKGFVSRGVKMEDPLPASSLVLFQRIGPRLELLDSLSQDDGIVSDGIKWIGTKSFISNEDRILSWSNLVDLCSKNDLNAWNSGLISTLNLSRINLNHNIMNKWIYTAPDKQGKVFGPDDSNLY
jgi:hypothetical protein